MRARNGVIDVSEGVAVEPPAVPGARARQREQTRGRLLAAAREVFAETSYADVRVGDISARAGVSHGLFYHYFPSKQDLFRELTAQVYEDLVESLDVVMERGGVLPLVERFDVALRRALERHRREARLVAVIEEVSRFDEDVAAIRETAQRSETERTVGFIRDLQRLGRADPDLDAEVAAAALQAMIWQLGKRWFVLEDLDLDFDHGIAQLSRIARNALGLVPGDSPPR